MSALGQRATAAALLTVGGRVTWQSALGQRATAAVLLTVGRRACSQGCLLTPLLKKVVDLLTCLRVLAVTQKVKEAAAVLLCLSGMHQL